MAGGIKFIIDVIQHLCRSVKACFGIGAGVAKLALPVKASFDAPSSSGLNAYA